MDIQVQKLSYEEAQKQGITRWPIWEKEISTFDWYYDSTETCYFLEGLVEVTPKGSQNPITIGQGDLVTFPAGLSCTWKVIKPVRKHYNFE